jgi:mono/diheme cytochrome c family protein
MRTPLKTTLIAGAALALAGAITATATSVTIAASDRARVDRGRYLVDIMACSDCHTPMKMGPRGPEPDRSRFLSGHPESAKMPPPPAPQGRWIWSGDATNTAFAGPWGISYAANLTADTNTGLGIWTEQMFVDAMRTGRHMGTARAIVPPMPSAALGHATDEDLKAIYAYLRTITPVVNHVPDYAPPPTEQRS